MDNNDCKYYVIDGCDDIVYRISIKEGVSFRSNDHPEKNLPSLVYKDLDDFLQRSKTKIEITKKEANRICKEWWQEIQAKKGCR